MVKRIYLGIVFFVILVINTLLFSMSSFAEEAEDYVENFDDTVVEGLDIVWSKETDSYGVVPVYDAKGDMYAIKTWVTQTRPIIITHKLSNTINEGMFYISFDYKTEEKFNDSFLRLKSGNTQFQICGFRNTGKFGHFLEFSKWALNKDTSVEYAPDIWYKVGILFDMTGEKAYLYFGESGKSAELIETVDIPQNFGNITDVVIAHSFGEYTPAMWDNFKIYNVTSEKIENIETTDKIKFESEIYKNYTDVRLREDFQTNDFPDLGVSGWSDSDAVCGIQREMTDENEYSLKSWVGLKNPMVLTHSLKSPIESGVYVITYDWLSKDGYNDSYLRLEKNGERYQVCGFRNTGTFGKFIEFSKWALNKDTEIEYKPDVWYTVSVVLDFDLRNVYIMFGERGKMLSLIEKEKMTDDFTAFNNIIFVHSYGDYPEILWDNMRIYKLNYETVSFIETEMDFTFDESVKTDIALLLKTENKGNIFSNAENMDVSVIYSNRSLVKSEYDVVYELSYNGEIVFLADKKMVIPQNGVIEDKISLPTENKYGFFTLRILNSDRTKVLAETRLSNVHTAKDNVKNEKVGTTLHLSRVKDKEGAFEILKKGGFSIVRGGQNDWRDVETAQGLYTTDSVNSEYYTLATENLFENMTILKGSNELYAEDYPTTNPEREGLVENPPQSDGLIERFAEYCYEAVIRYPQVKYFQLWNEWNNAPTFNADDVTGAEHYAKLLKAGYEAVKRAEKERGKEALVVAMAPSGTKATWISQVLEALKGERCFDIISVHPYTYTDGGANKEPTYAPEDVCVRHKTELGDVVMRIEAVKTAIAENGYEDIPVWGGEFGFSSYICGEEKQAQYATRMLALNDANNLLDKMLWYTFQNHSVSTEKEQNFGMIHNDDVLVPYEAKPVYLAMSNYNALMAKAEITEKIIDGDNAVYLYKFKGRDKGNIYTAWTTREEQEFNFESDSRLVEIYDLYGNKNTILNDDGSVTLTLSESISYIKEPVNYAEIVQNGRVIESLSDFNDGTFEMLTDLDGDYRIFLAQYKNDLLLNAVICEKGENMSYNLKPETDKIVVYFWNNMQPIADKLVIK